jgi:beta-lactamase regulating signal transducer with metallopeptidase domain
MIASVLELVLRAVVILTAAGAASFALKRAPASLRSGIWTLAFVSVLALPLLNRAMPQWRVAMWSNSAAEIAAPAPAPVPVAPAASAVVEPVEPATVDAAAATSDFAPAPRPRFTKRIEPPPAIEAAPPATPRRAPRSMQAVVISIWLIVAAWLASRVAWSHVQARRLTRDAVAADSADWRRLVDETRRTLRISRPVSVFFTEHVTLPAVAGVWRPSLLLPVDADEWTDDMRRIVLLHELAHVSRWDALRQMIERAVCACYWCVPLTWLAARRSSAIREQACDDVVLRAGVEGPAYAAKLIDLAGRACVAPAAALSMAQPSQMHSRVRRILNPSIQRRTVPVPAALAMFIVASGVISAASAIVPVEREAMAVSANTTISGPLADSASPVATAGMATSASASVSASSSANVAEVTRAADVTAIPDVASLAASDTHLPAATSASLDVPVPAEPAAQRATAQTNASPTASALCDGKNSSSQSIHEDNGSRRWTVKISSPGCSVDFRVDGKVDFNDDFTDVASLSAGGMFTLDVTDHGVRHQLDIRSRNGNLERTWKVNGTERPYDADAKSWLGAFLIELDRRTAVGADARLPKLLKQGGVDAVLRETAFMGDYPRSVYFSKTAAMARLTPNDVAHMLDQAASAGTSDYYAAEMMKSLAPAGRGDAGVHRSVMALVLKMKSDFYIAESIEYAVGKGPATPGDIDMLLQLIPRVTSDFYKTEVLQKILKAGALSPAQRAALAPAVSTMREDFYMAEFVKLLAGSGDLTARDRAVVIDAGGRVASAFYKAEVLKTIATDTSVGDAELQRMVTVARAIDSDFYKAETLTAIARHRSATDRTRQAVIDATAGMSRFYADEVLKVARAR